MSYLQFLFCCGPFCLVCQCLWSTITKNKKTGSSRESPGWNKVLRHCVRKTGSLPWCGKAVCPLHLFLSAEPAQKDVFFLEGKAYTFGSRTEIEKLSLTYFRSSASLALSSQAVWKSLNWETDSCNQTLALRETSWILIGVLLLDEVGRGKRAKPIQTKGAEGGLLHVQLMAVMRVIFKLFIPQWYWWFKREGVPNSREVERVMNLPWLLIPLYWRRGRRVYRNMTC